MNGDFDSAARAADFDVQAAWMRRFQADAESNLRAFAMRLHEAMPDRVTIRESKGLFARTAKTTGVTAATNNGFGKALYTISTATTRTTTTGQAGRGAAASTTTAPTTFTTYGQLRNPSFVTVISEDMPVVRYAPAAVHNDIKR